MADLTGSEPGPYQIIEEIGHGGMANVYRAVQTSIGREVAIKVLPAHFLQDRTFLERFNREVQVIARLQHPHILQVYDFGEYQGRPYIVMAYMRGGSLAGRIERQPEGMPLDEVARLVERIASALDYAHQNGVIHRDFKPSNVLLDRNDYPYLADFGIAKVAEATAQLTGTGIVGTPSYMAPEMIQEHSTTPLVDVYALGVTLYQMLTGRLPYQADTPMGIAVAHVTQPIPDARRARPGLPDSLQAVIERALAKDPLDRYQSAGELAAALCEAASGANLPAPGHVTPPPSPRQPDSIPTQVPLPTPPPIPTLDVGCTLPLDAQAASTVVEAPELAIPSRPARRGWVWAAVGLVGLGVLVGGLALAGVFGPPALTLPPLGPGEASNPPEPAIPPPGSAENPLVMAFGPSTSADVIVIDVHLGRIADWLNEDSGLLIEGIMFPTAEGVLEALCAGQAHAAVLLPISYIVAHDRGCANIELVALRFGSATWDGQIITRTDSGLESLADLRGRRFCRPNADSAGGWIAPMLMMKSAGPDPETDLGQIVDVGTPAEVVRAVYGGDCDAGGTFVDARADLVSEIPDVMEAILIVARSEPFPQAGIAFRPDVPEEMRQALINAILAMEAEEEGQRLWFDLYGWEGMERHNDAFYDGLRRLLESAGVEAETLLP